MDYIIYMYIYTHVVHVYPGRILCSGDGTTTGEAENDMCDPTHSFLTWSLFST